MGRKRRHRHALTFGAGRDVDPVSKVEGFITLFCLEGHARASTTICREDRMSFDVAIAEEIWTAKYRYAPREGEA